MARTAFGAKVEAWGKNARATQNDAMRIVALYTLTRMVRASPVGNPKIWAINSDAVAYNAAVKEHNKGLRLDADNLTKNGRLRRGLKVHDSMDVKTFDTYTGGRFRGNWQIGINVLPKGETGRIDKNGADTIAAGEQALEAITSGKRFVNSIYWANNVPYALRLEYGHSKQAPNGIVRITARNFAAYWDLAIRLAKQRNEGQ